MSNGRLVLPDEIVIGSNRLKGGRIIAIETETNVGTETLDLESDYLIPGLIDLHTDNLEKHRQPRMNVFWDSVVAAISHDAPMITAGITMVFDSLTLGAAKG